MGGMKMYGGDAECPLPRKRPRFAEGSVGMPPLREAELSASCPQPDIEHASEPAIVLTTTGHVLALNARAASLLGYARDELLGTQLAAEPDGQAAAVRLDLTHARARLALRHRSGRRVDVDATFAHDASGAIVATLRPRAAVPRRPDMAPIAAVLKHQLSLIASDVGLLHQRLPAYASSELQRALVRVEQNVWAVDRQVGEVLDLARIDADQLELSTEPIDLAELVVGVAERTTPAHERFRVLVHADTPAAVTADAMRIERVVANLIHYALTATSAPNEIHVDVEREDHVVRVAVGDGDTQLTPDVARRMFDRASLGLYVSRKIIEAHGGRMDVMSSSAAGARFFFELPVG